MENKQYRLLNFLEGKLGDCLNRDLEPNLNFLFSREVIRSRFEAEIPEVYKNLNARQYRNLLEQIDTCSDCQLSYLLATSRNILNQMKQLEIGRVERVQFLREGIEYKKKDY